MWKGKKLINLIRLPSFGLGNAVESEKGETRMMVSVQELGRMTGIHTEKIYRSVRENMIPHVRKGKRIYFHGDTVQEYFGSLIFLNKVIWSKGRKGTG